MKSSILKFVEPLKDARQGLHSTDIMYLKSFYKSKYEKARNKNTKEAYSVVWELLLNKTVKATIAFLEEEVALCEQAERETSYSLEARRDAAQARRIWIRAIKHIVAQRSK